jgi:hypothetical protein
MASSMKRAQTFSSPQDGTRPRVPMRNQTMREPPRNGDYYNLNQPVPRNRMSTASSTMSAADRHYINDDMPKPISQFDKKVTKIHAYFQNDQNVNDLEKRMN